MHTGKLSGNRIRAMAAAMLAVLLLLPAGCAGASPYRKYEHSFFGTFDTVIQIMGYTKSEDEFAAWAKKAETRFIELNRLFDMYNEYPGVANIKAINDSAGKAPVPVQKEIIDLIAFSKEWDAKRPGVINIALGPVLAVWHEYRQLGLNEPERAAVPPMEALRAAAEHTDIDRVIVNETDSTVFLEEPEMRIDVGSVAKGYATELVARELKAQGFRSFVINSGGNVRAVGAPLDGKRQKWGVGITDPLNPGSGTTSAAILDTAFISDMAVTTAGDYQRYYTVDGKRLSHIIDPETLMPATRFRAVTVAAADSSVADFLDTLLFILPYEDGRALVEGMDGVEALWVLPDGSRQATEGMKALLKGMGGAKAD